MDKERRGVSKIVCAFLALLLALPLGVFCESGKTAEMVAEAESSAPADALPVNHDLSKRDIPVTTNGTMVGITIVDETTDLGVKISSDPEETEDFYPEHKKWNGIPTVIQAGSNLFVAYYTGGKGEPDNNNYISVAASPDLGQTWQNPWMVITASPRGLVWPLFFYNGLGELCMTYGDNKMTGTQMIKLYDPAGPLDEITYSKPVKTGPPMSISCKPTLLSDGTLMSAYGTTLGSTGGTSDTVILRSTDNASTFVDYATIKSTTDNQYRVYAETSIVEKKDGTLWALRRLENAVGIEQSFSSDGGRTWTKATNDLPVPPFYSPGSRFYMARLKSGNLLFVTNMQGRGTDRRSMTVWLSEDDGESWPYSLLLDPTQSSYPDFYEGDDGTIYLVHDRDRYNEGGIRLHCFTEEDVRAGKFCSENAKQLISLTKKDSEYGDIVSVGGAFENKETYKVGTELASIIADKPKTIEVTDDNGRKYQISGSYRISGYDKNREGTYQAYFIPENSLPAKLKDGYERLNFEIVLVKDKGCGSIIQGGFFCAAALGTAICATIRFRRGKRKD